MEDVVYLNVGGHAFTTRRSTLLASNSFFSSVAVAHADAPELFIDRDPTHFRHVLNWMRGVRHLPEDDATLSELAWEADYYCMADLREAIQRVKARPSLLREIAGIHHQLRLQRSWSSS